MRADMYKVIVERPRRGGTRSEAASRGRLYRASEDVPAKMGIKQGIGPSKWLNENLNPLRRFIAAQVNRPWDKVYAEIAAGIDRRNTVQAHIYSHIEDLVCFNTRLEEGQVQVKENWWRAQWQPLADSSIELYVHPRTGILLRNRRYKSLSQRYREKRIAQEAQVLERRRILNEQEQLHCVDGIWYHVTLAALPGRETPGRCRWDALLREEIATYDDRGRQSDEPITMYGRHGVYALSKRQLSSRELKRYGLHQNGAQQKGRKTSRPFCFWQLLRCVAYMPAV